MFVSLVLKEIRYQLKSIILYIFIAIIALFYFTQFLESVPSSIEDLTPTPPEEVIQNPYGLPPYGSTSVDDPQLEMKLMYSRLISVSKMGQVLKHGLIINKDMKLTEEQINYLKEAANEISNQGIVDGNFIPDISYEQYQKIMDQVDEQLGGNTYFSKKYRSTYINRPRTYEEAKQSFENIVSKDKITGAFGRNFADYIGITAGIFPMFLSAFILTRDRKFKAHEIIYNRKISSIKYVLSKYTAINLIILLCYLIFATHATFLFSQLASGSNYSIDYFSFYYYTLAWIFPTVLFVTALSFLLSALFNNGIVALPILVPLWFSSLLPLKGDYSFFKYIIRFNTIGAYDKFVLWERDIIQNRISYLLISISLVLITSLVWSWKRGNLDGSLRKKFKTSKI